MTTTRITWMHLACFSSGSTAGQCLTMILTLIESNPNKAQQVAAKVREMRAKQEPAAATK